MGGDIYADNENTNTLRFSKFLWKEEDKKASASLEGCFYR